MKKIIVLSGPAGSGKTRISKAFSMLFQKVLNVTYLEYRELPLSTLNRYDLVIISEVPGDYKYLEAIRDYVGNEERFSLIIETQHIYNEETFASYTRNECFSLVTCKASSQEFNCSGLDLIKAERIRQITHEGFTPDKDLEYTDKELEDYAIFLLTGNDFYFPVGWDVKWKEKRYKRSRRENVIKVAALLAAHLNVIVKTEDSNVITEE